MDKKIGLVMTGGGARAAYQAGVVRALQEITGKKSNLFDVIAGNSAGAINATYYAAHCENWDIATRNLVELWTRIKPNNVYDVRMRSLSEMGVKWLGGTLFGGLTTEGSQANHLLDTKPLRRLIRRETDFSDVRKNIDKGHLYGLSLSTTNYTTGGSVIFYQGHPTVEEWARSDRFAVRTDLNEDHLMASSAIPFFFPPVKIGDSYFGDGCIRQTTPLSPAIHLGADKIIAIGVRFPHPKEKMREMAFSAAQNPTIGQILGVMMNAIFLDSLEGDVERLLKINRLSGGMRTDQKEIPILMLRPSKDLGKLAKNLPDKLPPFLRYLLKGIGVSDTEGSDLMSYLAFDNHYTGPLIELGYTDTLAKRDEVLRFIDV
ncbi:MAG: patatin-like phospholipase family protein [Bacteriovoracaceae bacterium]